MGTQNFLYMNLYLSKSSSRGRSLSPSRIESTKATYMFQSDKISSDIMTKKKAFNSSLFKSHIFPFIFLLLQRLLLAHSSTNQIKKKSNSAVSYLPNNQGNFVSIRISFYKTVRLQKSFRSLNFSPIPPIQKRFLSTVESSDYGK